jgi:hypothetical protein
MSHVAAYIVFLIAKRAKCGKKTLKTLRSWRFKFAGFVTRKGSPTNCQAVSERFLSRPFAGIRASSSATGFEPAQCLL